MFNKFRNGKLYQIFVDTLIKSHEVLCIIRVNIWSTLREEINETAKKNDKQTFETQPIERLMCLGVHVIVRK